MKKFNIKRRLPGAFFIHKKTPVFGSYLKSNNISLQPEKTTVFKELIRLF